MVLFEKGQIISMHQAVNPSKEIAEMTKIDFRIVNHFIKNWKDCGEQLYLKQKNR